MNSLRNTLGEKHRVYVAGASVLFALALSWCISIGQFLPMLIPFAIAIGLVGLMSLDKLLYIVVFLTPLSLKLSEVYKHPPFDMDLPTEPLLLGITFLFFLKYISERTYDVKILKHPVTIAIFGYLFWLFLTSVTSSMPLVSFKASLSKIWFLVPFYFIPCELFKKKENVKRYIIAYSLGMGVVSLYTLIRHSGHSFAHGPAHWVMSPFFLDHTSYGAVLVLLLPLLVASSFLFGDTSNKRLLYWFAIAFFVIATIFSYTRAAWLGLFVSAAVWFLMVFRIRVKYILVPLVIVGGLLFMNREQLIISMSQNSTESSTSFTEHIRSMTNISSDASNLERLNRWSCAIRMFEERPIVGWGPGTYMFQYAPFQLSSERTVISTNASNLGNAHSEYLGPLAESGLFGTLSVLWIFIATIFVAMRAYYKANTYYAQQLVLYALLALVTYYIHAFLNNFLDTDKVTALFWAATAMVVVIDRYHTSEHNEANLPRPNMN